MKRLLPLLVTVLLQTAPAPGVVEGIVVKAGTDVAIADVTVEMTGIAERPVASQAGTVFSLRTKTDRLGRFRLNNVPPGTAHQLIAVRFPEYLIAQYGQRVPSLPGVPIDVKAGQQLQGVRIEMTPAASISGRVMDSDGRGVRTEVRVIRPWYIGSLRVLDQVVNGDRKANVAGSVITDAGGRYRVEGLSPGQYYILATPLISNTRAVFHPGGTSSAEALPIDVGAGAAIGNVDLRFKRNARRSIKGSVVPNADGIAIRLVEVEVVFRNQPIGGAPIRSATRADGGFQITVLNAGNYDIFVRATDESDRLWWGRLSLDVSEDDVREISGLKVPVIRSFELPGRVSFEPDSSTLARRFNLSSLRFDLQPSTAGTPDFPGVEVSADGSFKIPNVAPGDYRIEMASMMSSLNAYVQSIRLGDRDVLNEGLSVQTTLPPLNEEFQVVLSLRGGVIDGRILDEKRAPASNIFAVLVPDASRRSRYDLYKSAITDDAGRFQFRGIPPGDYKVLSWERVEEGAWYDAAFLRLYENRGETVHMEAEGFESIDAVRIAAGN